MSQLSADAQGLYLFLNLDSLDSAEIVVGQTTVSAEDIAPSERYQENILILLDLSMSITAELQASTKEMLSTVIQEKQEDQRIMLLGFGESTEVLCDLTDDSIHLLYALEHLSFDKQASNIYDALNETLNVVSALDKSQLNQVVIFTDGVVYTDYGVTQNELLLMATKLGFEIQTVGLYKNNDSDLNELFALSRMTKGQSFNTKEQTAQDIAQGILLRNQGISQYTIPLSSQWADGSEKTVTLTVNGSELVGDVRIPTVVSTEPIPEPEPEPEPAPEPEPEPEIVPAPVEVIPVETLPEEETSSMLILLIPIVGVALLVGMLIFFTLSSKKKKQEAQEAQQNARYRPPNSGNHTVMVQEGLTEMLVDSDSSVSGVIMQTNNHNFSFTLGQSSILGRDSSADWVIPNEKSVSSRHCRIFLQGNEYFVEDLGSTNKTYINGQQVQGAEALSNGDILKLGRMEFVLKIEGRS